LRRDELFCPYHWFVFSNGAPALVAEVNRIMNFRARSAGEEATIMTPKERLKIAARARWAKIRAEAKENKNGAATKPEAAPISSTNESPATLHPLAGKSWTVEVEHGQLRASETNPRKDFKEEKLRELAESLKTNGQLQACLVRVDPKWIAKELKACPPEKVTMRYRALWLLSGNSKFSDAIHQAEDIMRDPDTRYEIVAGERRWRAAGPKFANLEKMLATVRYLTDEQVIEVQYVENLQRDDLTAIEEAEGFAKLIASGQYSADSLAVKLGKSRTYIFERVKLAQLEGPAKSAFAEGKISPSLAAVIAEVPDPKAQAMLFKKDRWGNVPIFDRQGQPEPVRSVKDWIERNLIRQIPWKLDATFEHKEMVSPACRECPKMSRNMDAGAAKGPPRCLALSCFEERKKALGAMVKEEAKAQGLDFWNAEEFSRNKHGNQYCVEGEQDWNSASNKTWDKVAGATPHAIVAETDEGNVVRVWRRDDLIKAGVLKKEPRSSGNDSYAKQQAAERAKTLFEEKVQVRVIEAVLKRIEVDGEFDSIVLLRKLAYALLTSLWDDSVRRIAKRRGVSKEELRKEAFVQKFGMGQCIGVLAEGLLLRGLRWTGTELSDDAAAWASIDVKKIREELKAEEKSKKNGKAAKSAKPAQNVFNEILDGANVSTSGLMADHRPKVSAGVLTPASQANLR
jgi:ParB/RepB/Spo0J family partition protein